MYHVRCLTPQIIVNPSLRHLIRFADSYCYVNSDFNLTVRSLPTDLRNRIIFGENPLNVLGLKSPNQMDFFSYDDKFDFCAKHAFLTSNGEVIDMFSEVCCGQCDLCRDTYRFTIRQRCLFTLQEVKQIPWFVTLTYKPGHAPRRGPDVRVIQLFKKRFRQVLERDYNYDASLVKFVCVSEDGKNHDNLHYHMLVFGCPLLHSNLETSKLIFTHLIEYLWRLPEYSFDDKGQQSLNPLSFSEYRLKYPLVTKRHKNYDPFSRGFVSVKPLDNQKMAVDYVTKYISKSFDDNNKNFVRYKDPITHKSEKKYVKYDYRGWRPHFFIMSQNMGLDFARSLTVRPDGKVSFVNWFDNTLYIVNLCNYYVKKLYPSMSVLVPPSIRRALDDALADIAILVRSRFCSRDTRRMLFNTSLYLRNNFPDFCADDIEDPTFKSEFPSEELFDYHLSSITRNVSLLYSFLLETDFDEIHASHLKRDAYFANFYLHPQKPPSPSQVFHIQQEIKFVQSLQKL